MVAKTKAKTVTKAKPVGRPSSYRPEFAEQAYNYCLLGATDIQLAEFFEVSEVTLNAWKKEFPEFLKSLKEGKELADAKVAQALFHRATGYSHPEVDIKMYEGHVIKTDLVKHYPPDTGAAMAWLKNRQGGLWRDKQEVDHKSTDGTMTPRPAVAISAKDIKEIAAALNDGI